MFDPKLNIHKGKSNQTKDIITTHYNNIDQGNRKQNKQNKAQLKAYLSKRKWKIRMELDNTFNNLT